MKIRIAGPASTDLERAFRFLTEHNPAAAHRVRSAIRESIRSLRRMPNRGRASAGTGTRELIVAATPYVVVYQVVDGEVLVLRVRHTSQDPSPG